MESEPGDQLAKAQIDISLDNDESSDHDDRERMGPVGNGKDYQRQMTAIRLRAHVQMSLFSRAKKTGNSDGMSSESIGAESKRSGCDVLEEKLESDIGPTGEEPNPQS